MKRGLASLLLVLSFSASAQDLDGWEECDNGKPDVAISACERVLKSAKTDKVRVQGHIQLGNAYSALNQTEKALAEYDAALKIEPENFTAMLNRSAELIRMGRDGEALLQLDRATRLNPASALPFNNRAIVHLKMGKPDDALAAANRAIELDPAVALAHNARSLAYQRLGRIREALIDIDRAIALEEKNEIFLERRAELYAMNREPDKAIADLTTLIEANPAVTDYYNSRGVVRARAGAVEDALADFTAAIERKADSASLYNRGFVLEKAGKTSLALKDYDAALDLDPNFAVVHAARGLLKLKLGNKDEALTDLRTAERYGPEQTTEFARLHADVTRMALNAVADAMAQLQDQRGSSDRYTVKNLYWTGISLVGPLPGETDVRDADRKDSDVATKMSLAASAPGTSASGAGSSPAPGGQGPGPGPGVRDDAKTLSVAGQALTPQAADKTAAISRDPELENNCSLAGMSPCTARTYAIFAKELLEKGQRTGESFLEKAFEAANTAVGLAPNDPLTREVRAELHSAKGEADAAIADLTVASGIALSDPHPLNARGVLLARRGDFAAAMSDFEAALEIEGGAYKYAHYNRGYINEKLGHHDEALQAYDEAVSSDPEFFVALAARGILKEKMGRREEARMDLEAAKKLRSNVRDVIGLKMANLVADAQHGPPGRTSFCNLDAAGVEVIGPLPEKDDMLQGEFFARSCKTRSGASRDGAGEARSGERQDTPAAARPASQPPTAEATSKPPPDAQLQPAERRPSDDRGGRILSAQEVFSLFNGNTSDGTMIAGGIYREYYARGGDIRMKSHSGAWWLKENQFCTSYQGMKTSCFDVRSLQHGSIVWEQEGTVLGSGRVIKGNPYKF